MKKIRLIGLVLFGILVASEKVFATGGCSEGECPTCFYLLLVAVFILVVLWLVGLGNEFRKSRQFRKTFSNDDEDQDTEG